jgi:hypothetical protein
VSAAQFAAGERLMGLRISDFVFRSVAVLGAAKICALPLAGAEAPKVGVRGAIEKITPATDDEAKRGVIGHVHVKGKKEADTEVDQAVAIVMKDTRLMRLEKEKRVPIRFADLKAGQRVEARWAPGPKILIYPLRAAVTEMVVMP